MNEFIEKLIKRLEEIPVGLVCGECPNILKCNEIEDSGIGKNVDLCGATTKQLAIEIVNQLAEEYNNDFCEWKQEDEEGFVYCPYCGKKIKVVE